MTDETAGITQQAITPPVLTATVSDIIKTTNTTVSTDTATGALQVGGGAGIVGTVNIGRNLTVGGNVIVSGTGTTVVKNMTALGNVIVAGKLSVTNVVWQANAAPFTGARGFSGSIGATGAGYSGSRGIIGYAGSRGSGYVGSRGSAGYTGSEGTAGSPGDPGSPGGPGYTGSASTAAGYHGSKGYTGSAGAGYYGSKGYTGSFSFGFAGSKGFVGSAGNFGYTGSYGAISYGNLTVSQTSVAGQTIRFTSNLTANSSGNLNISISNNEISFALPNSMKLVETVVTTANVVANLSLVTSNIGNISSNITPDWAVGSVYSYTLKANANVFIPANMPIGSAMTLVFTQDTFGNRAMTPKNSFTGNAGNIVVGTYFFAGNIKTLSTAANTIDMMNIVRVTSTQYLAALSLGYK